jgi:hypothetical protein
MRTTLLNLAKSLEGRYCVLSEELPDGIAVVIHTLTGERVAERRFTRRQTGNKELVEIILTDVRNQLLHREQQPCAVLTQPLPPAMQTSVAFSDEPLHAINLPMQR